MLFFPIGIVTFEPMSHIKKRAIKILVVSIFDLHFLN